MSKFHKSSWNMAPPAMPVFDPAFYPAYLHGADIPGWKKLLTENLAAISSLPTHQHISSAVDDMQAQLGRIVEADVGKFTYLPDKTPFQRYLDDYKAYAEYIEAHKKALHERKVVERAIRKNFKLGIATADTPEMNKGVSFRQTTAEKELLADPHSHLAWHPRTKQAPPKAKDPALAEARQELKKAVIAAKVTKIKSRAEIIPALATDNAKIRRNKEATRVSGQLQKLSFAAAVTAEKSANIPVAAHAAAGKQLAATKARLEKVEAVRAKRFNSNGKPVTFPYPEEGEFLHPTALTTSSVGGSTQHHILRFGTILTEETLPEFRDDKGVLVRGQTKITRRLPVSSIATADMVQGRQPDYADARGNEYFADDSDGEN